LPDGPGLPQINVSALHGLGYPAMKRQGVIVGAPELIVELTSRELVFAPGAQLESNSPVGEGCMAALHDTSSRHSKILAAIRGAAAVAADFTRRVMLLTSAMGANRTSRPSGRFEPSPRSLVVMEMGACKVPYGHDENPFEAQSLLVRVFVFLQ
jgi:hypothetical protein